VRAVFLGILFGVLAASRVGVAEEPATGPAALEAPPTAAPEASPTAVPEAPPAVVPEAPPTAVPEAPATAVAEPGAASVVEALEAKYRTVDALKADFVQTTHSSVYGDDVQRGHLLVKRPAMMRWEFEGDEERQFVTDGKTMWVYTKADQQVIRYDDIGSDRSPLDSLLSSLDHLDELFDVRLGERAEGSTTLELTPHDQEEVKRARLVLDENLVVQHLTIVDPFDSVTDLAFSNLQLDPEIPDSAFEFVVPEGVEVIPGGGF